jgi:hypothetical protein
MASSLPIVRQIAWLSLLPQLALLVGVTVALDATGIENAPILGALLCLAALFTLRFLVARDHRRGLALFKKEDFAPPHPFFENNLPGRQSK